MPDKTLGPKWDVKGDHYALREDGVTAKFTFSGARAFAVHRVVRKKFEWMPADRMKVSTFKTLAAAMKAADKRWPLKGKTNG